MKWIEIIELRSACDTRKKLETCLQVLSEQLDKETIEIYTRLKVDTDVSIHLHHYLSDSNAQGSTLGLRLVSMLKSFGQVNHNIWIEKPKRLSDN